MENIKLPLSTSFYIWICSPTLDILITAIAPGRHLLMSAIAVCFTESGPATSLPHYDIRERVAGLQNLSSAKMNQRPKLGSGQGALNVHNWVVTPKMGGYDHNGGGTIVVSEWGA